MRTVLITGTSAGFGQLATVELAKRGWRVIATMRNLDRKGPLEAALAQSGAARNVDIVQLDVTDADSIIKGVAEALTITGGFLDAVVHNAGVASGRRLRGHPRRRGAPGDGDQPVRRHGADAGAAADVPQAAVGAHRDRLQRGRASSASRATRSTCPPSGRWRAGRNHSPSRLGNSASRCCSSSRARTSPTSGSPRRVSAPTNSAYRPWAQYLFRAIDAHVAVTGGQPQEVAERIAHVLEAPRPRFRNPVGSQARIVHFARGKFPSRWLRRGFEAYLGSRRVRL